MNLTRNLLIFIWCVHGSYTVTLNEYKTYKNYRLYEIEGSQDAQENIVRELTEKFELPFHVNTESKTQILISPELVQTFEELVNIAKLKSNIIINDYSEIIQAEKASPRNNKFSWTAYYDVDMIYEYLQNTSKSYSNWTQLIVGGESYEGRQILGLRINTQQNLEDRPVMFIESGIHAREWIAPATTTYFINQLLTSNDPNITALRDQFDWRIFPTVNPDGYHYSYKVDRMWRKTRSRSSNGCYGADPNRNWDHNWMNYSSSSNPCDYQIYAGSRPFSEIETRTLSTYISEIENLLGYVAFHSYAQTLLIPYSDSTEHVDNYDDLVQIGRTSLEYGRSVNGKMYDGPGTAAEILYKASGGSMDWVRHALGTPIVYTYELRGAYFYWPPGRIHEQGDEVTQMLLGLATEARNLGYY